MRILELNAVMLVKERFSSPQQERVALLICLCSDWLMLHSVFKRREHLQAAGGAGYEQVLSLVASKVMMLHTNWALFTATHSLTSLNIHLTQPVSLQGPLAPDPASASCAHTAEAPRWYRGLKLAPFKVEQGNSNKRLRCWNGTAAPFKVEQGNSNLILRWWYVTAAPFKVEHVCSCGSRTIGRSRGSVTITTDLIQVLTMEKE